MRSRFALALALFPLACTLGETDRDPCGCDRSMTTRYNGGSGGETIANDSATIELDAARAEATSATRARLDAPPFHVLLAAREIRIYDDRPCAECTEPYGGVDLDAGLDEDAGADADAETDAGEDGGEASDDGGPDADASSSSASPGVAHLALVIDLRGARVGTEDLSRSGVRAIACTEGAMLDDATGYFCRTGSDVWKAKRVPIDGRITARSFEGDRFDYEIDAIVPDRGRIRVRARTNTTPYVRGPSYETCYP